MILSEHSDKDQEGVIWRYSHKTLTLDRIDIQFVCIVFRVLTLLRINTERSETA